MQVQVPRISPLTITGSCAVTWRSLSILEAKVLVDTTVDCQDAFVTVPFHIIHLVVCTCGGREARYSQAPSLFSYR